MGRILRRSVIALALGLSTCFLAIGQGTKPAAKPAVENLGFVKSSPAYAELQLRRTELVSDLESLLIDYNEEFPKIKELRFTIALLDRDIARISKVKSSDASKLTLALGKLILRRVDLEIDLSNLLKNYKDEHPDVKRAKRKVEIYEAAVTDILN